MILFDLPAWLMLSWLFVLGAVLGSFLNVCIYRIPQHDRLWDQLRGIGYPPSRCPRCKQELLLRDNIPILGWLWLRGRCRSCQMRISIRYPLIELFNGLLFVLVYWYEIPFDYGASLSDSPLHTGFSISSSRFWSQSAILHWRYAFHMVMLEALVVATFIDFDRMEIPDGATVPAMLFAFVVSLAVPQVHLVPVWFSNPDLLRTYAILLPEGMRSWLDAGAGGGFGQGVQMPAWLLASPHLHGFLICSAGWVIGGGIVWVVRIIGGWVLRREAMGFGDVVLMAMIGSFLGWQAAAAVFFLAPAFALLAALVSWLTKRSREIPYGPYLSLSALALLLGWPRIWPTIDRVGQLGPFLPVLGAILTVMLAVCLFLLQGAKRLLGIPLYPEDEAQPWTSADTLTYLAGENADPRQGQWQTSQWPGIAAGRGTRSYDAWRGRNGF